MEKLLSNQEFNALLTETKVVTRDFKRDLVEGTLRSIHEVLKIGELLAKS